MLGIITDQGRKRQVVEQQKAELRRRILQEHQCNRQLRQELAALRALAA